MTLKEISDILNKNIDDNAGTLKLSATLISSDQITALFDEYLLNEDLVVNDAEVKLYSDNVTVAGKGNSFIFFNTDIYALKFKVDNDANPIMSVNANAIVETENGWGLGKSFPVLEYSFWGGYYDPANASKWIQYIFFESGSFSLTTGELRFTGYLEFTGTLTPLAVLFSSDKARVDGLITINKGDSGFVADSTTAVPLMTLDGNVKTEIQLGSFPMLTLSFSMDSLPYNIDFGSQKGQPVPKLEMLIKSTIPIDDEEVGMAIVIGAESSLLTMRAILPEEKEIGMSELIALANNENVLAIMPSNIPVLYDFYLKDFEITFNTEAIALKIVSIEVATRESFSWVIIPGFLTLKSVNLAVTMTYLAGKFSPSMVIEGVITIGSGDTAVNIILSASFPEYVFIGSLDPETPVDLKAITTYFLGETIGNSLPDTLLLGVLTITVDPKNSTYSLETALTTDLEIPVILTTIVVRTVLFNINYVAGAGTGNITGEFQVGTTADAPFMFVTAAYNGPETGWMFSGGLKDGSKISLENIINTYLPEEYQGFLPLDITINTLFLSFNQAPLPENNTYNFKFGAEWKLDLGLTDPFIISGLTEIAYTKKLGVGVYTGFVEGALNLGNITIGARVDFKEKYNDYTFFFNGFEARLTHNIEGDSIICFQFTDESSLGSLIALLINAATGEDITLPSPWNIMNNIKLKNFGFSFNLTKNKIGFSYTANINLGFINIKEITLFYTYYPNEPNKPPLVEIGITDGSFLGGAAPLPAPWNALDPQKAPAIPGQGETLFRLEFMGLGQHVSLKDGLSPKSVTQAIDMLKAGFDRKDKLTVNPIESTGLKFNSSSNWLIGTQFVIVDTFAIGIVFFDPDLYGLSLYVNGPKAKIFQGLKFEILYKKVSDTVGVYQVYLKLPDAIRQIDFGSVSVTLPSIKIYIYTNGDFKIDFGFPANDDFSESFGLQILPFVGSGGFYFGLLSAETAETVPKATNGSFSPVIVFGVGLRVGIGKEINKGILKAGITIVVQGILEGTYAQFNLYNGGSNDVTYFYVLGKIAIVGHVYGAINFAIISAELDLRVFASVRLVFESYEPILITLSAGVSVSLKVRINLGIFSFSINLSFSATITESFTIGSKQQTPWVIAPQYAAFFRQPALRALDEEVACAFIPVMNWLPVIPATKVDLEIIFIPQFTAATDEGGVQKARAVAMLYLESSIDQPTPKQQLLRNGVAEEVDYAFTKFAKGAFLWVLGAYFNQTSEGMPVETLLAKEINIAKLQEILCYFSQDDLIMPFTVDNVFDFMAGYLNATVVIPPRTTQIVAEQSVSVLPILPNLIFNTPAGDVYFDNAQAEYTYNQAQLKLIHDYFNELSVRSKGTNAPQSGLTLDEEEKQSLATFMLIDYISLLAKESSQKGIDRLSELAVNVDDGDSAEDIVNKNPHFGISAIELAHANRKRNLTAGTRLGIKNIHYTVKHHDTIETISEKFNVQRQDILKANSYVRNVVVNPCTTKPLLQKAENFHGFDENHSLIAGSKIIIPEIKHIISTVQPESLLSVANKYNVHVLDLIAENTATSGLFQAGKKIMVPFVEKMTVADLIAAMEENHDFEQLSGLSANIMLQGLRVPLPGENSTIGVPEAMYKVSGQEINASELVLDQILSIKLPETLEWLNLGEPEGIELQFKLLQEDIDALSALQNAALQPVIIELKPTDLYEVQARKFTLPANITWQLPVVKTLAINDASLLEETDPSVWMFQDSLNALLNGYDAVAPKVKLLKQVQETVTKSATPDPITNYSWATKIDVRLQQVKSAANPALLMPNVYELQGIDQASMSLLQNLILYYAANSGTSIINEIDILYTKEPAKEDQTEPPSGLRSDSIDNTSIFLLQTNLSTLSNPPQLSAMAKAEVAAGTQANLLGMSQIDFVKYAWEAAIVGSGGYYLYYQIKDSLTGLPEYLFNGDTDNVITLVITYNVTDGILRNFMNCAVIKDPINIQDEILYVETLPQLVSGVTMAEGDTLQSFARKYNTTVSEIALQNKTSLFRSGTRLSLPQGALNAVNGEHFSGSPETIEAVAQKYGVSIIALAHANKNNFGLFAEPLTFDSRIEVKVATVPPGNIGFTMKRQNPVTIPGLNSATLNLQQLYNLLGYNIADNDDFKATVSGLPVAPGDNQYVPPSDIDQVVRPTAITDDDLLYNRILPVYPFVKTETTDLNGDNVPPENENPYRAVGKTVQVDMRWHDIFGNLTPFTNTGGPGINTSLPPVTVGYTDPVIGISLYPSVSASYIVENDLDGVPNLYITLAFNPTNYLPIDEVDETWKKRAISDHDAYKQIYYQLSQEDVKLSIINSLEGTTGIKAIEDTAKETLLTMVLAIYQYLGEIIADAAEPYVNYIVKDGDTLESIATTYDTTPENIRRANPAVPADGELKENEKLIIPLFEIPADQVITYPLSDSNPLSLFALVTKLTVSRDIELVNDNFKDEPSVIASTSVLGPNLRKDGSADNSNSITIQDFAQKLQDAFPELKAASGMPQLGADDDGAIEIWVARFNESSTGIRFAIPNAGRPFYFALLPLSTHLLARDKVKIYPYKTGVPIWESIAIDAAVSGIDMEKLAQTCLEAVDVFLQADFSIPAWNIENTYTGGAGSEAVEIPYPYQQVINAKKKLAENIVKHMAVILEDDNAPDSNNTENAKERLKQELLISLSNAYTIDTILQFNVDVKSQYTNPDVIAPQLFGKVIDPNNVTQTDQKAYAFSTTRFSLENSDEGNSQQSYLTILFNTKKDNNLHLESGYFPIDLQYEINSIEHNIKNVDSIEGYKSSSWLTFILPFESANTALGDLKIPIPLRAYPTSPSLTSQTFESFNEPELLLGLSVEDKLQLAKEWDYLFTYDYLKAQQDTINTDIIVNVPSESVSLRLFADEEEPDLLAALLQFSSAYPDIQKDLNQYLMDQSNPGYAFTAMQSFAWLVQRVAKAWGNWQESKQMYADNVAADPKDNKYQLVEAQEVIDGQAALLITVTPQDDPEFSLPDVNIAGFITDTREDETKTKSFAYYTLNDDVKTYLSPDDGAKITQRIIRYSKFNIINQENVWSGISVIRNKILVPDVTTNPDFIYTTPTIRFISVLTPLLDSNAVINIADYTPGDDNQLLQVYLSNFLRALFVELANETTTRQIKTGTLYSYNIQEGVEGLNTEIPIMITTPFNFDIPADWDASLCPTIPGEVTPDSAFVCQLTALIQQWFANNTPATTNAMFRFDISLFSGLSNTQLPVLRLRNLYLDEKDIKWD